MGHIGVLNGCQTIAKWHKSGNHLGEFSVSYDLYARRKQKERIKEKPRNERASRGFKYGRPYLMIFLPLTM